MIQVISYNFLFIYICILQCQISTILSKEDQHFDFSFGKKERLKSEVPAISDGVCFWCSIHSCVQGHNKGKDRSGETLLNYLFLKVLCIHCDSILHTEFHHYAFFLMRLNV
jgi:hypothetical protein